MPLLLKTHYSLARQSLRRTRTRSLLTCVGISIGVASLCLILSLTGSIKSLLDSELTSVGDNLLVVRPTSGPLGAKSFLSDLSRSAVLTSSLTLDDVDTIKSTDNISLAAPIALSYHSLSLSDGTSLDSVPTLATTPDFREIHSLSLSYGTFFSSSTADNSAVIGSNLKNSLFGTESPIGKTFTILGQRFIIIGVLSEINNPQNFNNIDLDSAVIVNSSFYSTLSPLTISQINLRASESGKIPETISSLTSLLSGKKSDNNFTILAGSDISHPSSSLLSSVSLILSLICAISLVVGGIGIMNIMLVSVAERTHEIGIRKSVGATNSNIFGEFLIESVLLSSSGGFLGIILGYILSILISFIAPFAPYFSPSIILITFGTALLTGLIFGIFPAVHAARKDPIRSLKSYY